MKKFILFIALSIFVLNFINGQITDYEKELRKKNKDSLSGWKINGLTSINFSQSSLINWAAGGQNNISANGLISFTANFYAQIIYDDDVIIEVDSNNDGIIDKKGPRMQFKEIFGIGFSYKFDNKK